MQFTASELVRSISDVAFVLASDGSVVAANQAARRLFAGRETALEGVSLTSLVLDPPERIGHYLSLCARTTEPLPGAVTWRLLPAVEHRTEGVLLRPRTADSHAFILLRSIPQAKASEQFIVLNDKIAELSREIVERKRIQQERDELLESERAARLDAERVSRVKDEFLSTLSHELRTPLNAIMGWTQLLRLYGGSDSETTQAVETIERNAKIQAQLIEDLLDMSRIISGKVRLDVQHVDLASVIEAAIETILPSCEAKRIRLQKVLDPLAGPVKGDPSRLQQVIWNLLSNAVKFTPKGGRIQIHLERVNSHVELSVIDNGSGIVPEFLPHVFERFRQAESSFSRSHGGLGLGLSIVRHLVELHGGTVRAKSPGANKGATFIVALPLIAIHHEAAEERRHPAVAPKVDQPLCPPVLEGLKVLVVDDEPDSLQVIRRLLEDCHCVVQTAGSVSEAMNVFSQHRPDVLISDLGMPQEDGYVLIEKIRALPSEQGGTTPAIALTAFARSEDRRRSLLAGFQLHVAKPVDFPELLACVANLSDKGRRHRPPDA